MYKLLALDIDGTLLNSKGEVEETTKAAISEAQKSGVLVTLSTGRPIQGVRKYIQALSLETLVITYNGAMILDSKNDKVIYNQGLSNDDAKEIIEIGLAKEVSLIIWANNELYVNRIDENVNKYKLIAGNEPIVVEDYDAIIERGITKILWLDTADAIQTHAKEVANIMVNRVNYCTSQPTFLEFFNINVSKAQALEYLGKAYGISREEMIAVGDGNNDLSMIEYAGLGVAMGNAKDGVKSKADFITKSNDENGIEHVINKFIINKGDS